MINEFKNNNKSYPHERAHPAIVVDGHGRVDLESIFEF